LLTILVVVEFNRPAPFSWNETYAANDEIPFGASVLYNHLDVLFPDQPIDRNNRPIYHTLPALTHEKNNLILVAKQLELPERDWNKILEFASEGNQVFIAAEKLDDHIQDTLGIKLKRDNFEFTVNFDSLTNQYAYVREDTLRLRFTHSSLNPETEYSYEIIDMEVYVEKYDSKNTEVLAVVSDTEKVHFIKIKVGEGCVFLHTMPIAFSNYYIAHPQNHAYAFTALSHLPVMPTVWDEYYKKQRLVGKSQSPLRFFMSHPSLKAFVLLTLVLLLLYLFLYGRRRQREIPELSPPRNATLDFIKTISGLYFNSDNHKNIADKKINYFFDYLRTEFQVRTNVLDKEFIQQLAQKPELEEKFVQGLINFIKFLREKDYVDDEELIKLNGMMNDFYNKNIR
jgi:hypothetical protein